MGNDKLKQFKSNIITGRMVVLIMDEFTSIIMASLNRIESKLDNHGTEISTIAQRLAIVEAKLQQQSTINQQVQELVSVKDKGTGIKIVVAWLITTILAIWGAFFK